MTPLQGLQLSLWECLVFLQLFSECSLVSFPPTDRRLRTCFRSTIRNSSRQICHLSRRLTQDWIILEQLARSVSIRCPWTSLMLLNWSTSIRIIETHRQSLNWKQVHRKEFLLLSLCLKERSIVDSRKPINFFVKFCSQDLGSHISEWPANDYFVSWLQRSFVYWFIINQRAVFTAQIADYDVMLWFSLYHFLQLIWRCFLERKNRDLWCRNLLRGPKSAPDEPKESPCLRWSGKESQVGMKAEWPFILWSVLTVLLHREAILLFSL